MEPIVTRLLSSLLLYVTIVSPWMACPFDSTRNLGKLDPFSYKSTSNPEYLAKVTPCHDRSSQILAIPARSSAQIMSRTPNSDPSNIEQVSIRPRPNLHAPLRLFRLPSISLPATSAALQSFLSVFRF